MNRLAALLITALLAACGAETATTAATGAAIKKQEIEQGRKTEQEARRKIDQAMEEAQSRANRAGDPSGY